MKNHRLKIQFDGSKFHGWQYQTNSSPTVQEVINKALAKIYKARVTTMGSGRTDAKVHALKYYVFYEAPFEIEPSAIVKGLNSNLPDQVRVLDVDILTEEVHPTMDAKSREYRYYFSNEKIPSAFQDNYLGNISYELDFSKMELACQEFIGEFDFASYQTLGSDVKTTVRTIFECSLHKSESNSELFPSHYYIKVVGNGFLKQMVRMIVGAIWEVGRGKMTCEQIKISLTSEIGKHIAPVAPAQGLYKYDIVY